MMSQDIQLLPNFGIFHLTIKDAAKLIVADMRSSTNLIEIEEPEGWEGDEGDPRVQNQLAELNASFEETLLNEIDLGRLKAATTRRGFDNRLIADETYISYEKMIDWLRERNYYLEDGIGEIIGDWLEGELSLAERIGEQVKYLRAEKNNGLDRTLNPVSRDNIPDEYKAKVLEIISERDSLLAEVNYLRMKDTESNTATGGDHVSDKLALLKQAAFKFWAPQNENTRSTHPDNSEIESWLTKRGFSVKQAEAATSIIRPGWAPPGRKPKE